MPRFHRPDVQRSRQAYQPINNQVPLNLAKASFPLHPRSKSFPNRREFMVHGAAAGISIALSEVSPLPKVSRPIEKKITTEIGSLPITAYKEEICRAIRNSQVTIINADTGAGKSTQVPQYIAEMGKIVHVVQPRRLATAVLAEHVKNQYMFGPDAVGFKHALNNSSSNSADITYYTDGYFLQLLMDRKSLGSDDVIVLDEVHEFSESMEAMLAIMRQRIREGSAPKLVLMSATMKSDQLVNYYRSAESAIPVLEIPGRTFGRAELQPEASIAQSIAKQVSHGREVLVFLSGKREIAEIEQSLKSMGLIAEILPLHSKLPAAEQDRVHKRYKKPRVILATNVAQSSITIDGIEVVIISGRIRRERVEAGVKKLSIELITQAEYLQQIGRVGRTKFGYIINHGCKFEDLPSREHAPIQNSTLESLYLRLFARGYNPRALCFAHAPSAWQTEDAIYTLQLVGALNERGKITELGRVMSNLPLDPRPAKLVALAQSSFDNERLLAAAIDIAALVQVEGLVDNNPIKRNVIPGGRVEQWRKQSDLLGQLCFYEKLMSWESLSPHERNIKYQTYNVDQRALEQMQEYRSELRRRLKVNSDYVTDALTEQELSQLKELIMEAWSDMIFYMNGKDKRGRPTYVHAYGKGLGVRYKGKRSGVRDGSYLIGMPIDIEKLSDGGVIRTSRILHSVCTVDRNWLHNNAPHGGKGELRDALKKAVDSQDISLRKKIKRSKGPRGSKEVRGRGIRFN